MRVADEVIASMLVTNSRNAKKYAEEGALMTKQIIWGLAYDTERGRLGDD